MKQLNEIDWLLKDVIELLKRAVNEAHDASDNCDGMWEKLNAFVSDMEILADKTEKSILCIWAKHQVIDESLAWWDEEQDYLSELADAQSY